ncbi:acyl-CoA thioesterase [Rhodococcus sp. WWJCD1]|uniref:acyl-CoA thioesterase n=1 Tax=Rhodococcus sp. WWJCD1 TaxID=2022519 RepID=UPI0015957DB5|nr:acyl-CoA thioesterase [Rhodococcus sp. WWJCD1]
MLMTVRWLVAMIPPRQSQSAVEVGEPVDTPFRVLPSDLDLLMHMTNGRYLSILDAARIAYWTRTGLWRQLRAKHWHPVVVAQTINYRRSLTLGVRYQVRTTMLGFDKRNAFFEHVFRVDEAVYANAVVAVRLLDRHGASVTPKQVLELDAQFAPARELPDWIEPWLQSARTSTSVQMPIV